MSVKSMAYDNPTYVTRQVTALKLPAILASAPAGKFVAFTSMKIKSISMGVDVAGTATGAAYDIFNGTSSVGQILAGTNAADTILTALVQDIALSSGGMLNIKTAAASATLAASATIEFEITPGADVTA